MHALVIVIFLALSAAASTVFAREVKVGDLVAEVAPPSGFCELDMSSTGEKSYFDNSSKMAKAIGQSLIAQYPDCGELKTSKSSGAPIITRVWFVSMDGVAGKASSSLVSETCDELRTRQYGDDDKVAVAKAAKEFAGGNSTVD
jgi:hypothetical protein